MENNNDFIDECSYSYKIFDNILSLSIIQGSGMFSNYYAYNFDLTTGRISTYQEVYEKIGFNSSTINEKAKSVIRSVMQEKLNKLNSDNYFPGTNAETFINLTLQNYDSSVNDNTIKILY